jgi:hypothetical protein
MGANVWFWLIYVLAFLFGGYAMYPRGATGNWYPFGGYAVQFILIGILGFAVFGSPIR